nr:MAG TPA: hypothetical protein [Caudoviricetes sp.]
MNTDIKGWLFRIQPLILLMRSPAKFSRYFLSIGVLVLILMSA